MLVEVNGSFKMMYPIYGNRSVVYVCLGYYFVGVEGVGDNVQAVSQSVLV
jgi:hypothetical protein